MAWSTFRDWTRLLKRRVARPKHVVESLWAWHRRGYSMPAPDFVKRAVLMRYGDPGAIWVETGTYLGQTTEFLARRVNRVFSIEPSADLVWRARLRLGRFSNVEVLEGSSEQRLEEVLAGLSGRLCLWLDAHFSGGSTFQGEKDTPILQELSVIGASLHRFEYVVVFIDDVRCFDPAKDDFNSYPPLTSLVEWAVGNEMAWMIEHDILIAIRASA